MVIRRAFPCSATFERAFVVVVVSICALALALQSSATSSVLQSLAGDAGGEQITMSMSDLDERISRRTFVVTTTYYPDLADVRFGIALELCRLARQYKVHLIVVDDSPQHDAVREQFQEAGTAEYVRGKGGALRQAIERAAAMVREDGRLNPRRAVICFTEPEKVDLINHIHRIAAPILDGSTDVVIPRRNDALFKRTYPIEQYHSESFGNLHFDLLAKQFEGFRAEGAATLDWLFGPFALKASLAEHWLDYEGTSWDAQIVPYVRGVRQEKWRIRSVEVAFEHPRAMKEQEEGYPAWMKKRLHQLNLLFDLLGDKELSP
ncbi:hypothetical protein ACHAXT_001297 [Thalassiosira profunda]